MVFPKAERLTVFDGAIGTEVLRRIDHSTQKPTELFNLSHPETIKKIHLDYLKAGAQFLTTNTFSANEIRLSRINDERKLTRINEEAVKQACLAREEFDQGDQLIAGSIGPTGEAMIPLGKFSFDMIQDCFYKQAKILKRAGVDWFVIETMESLRELKAALVAVKEIDLPVIGCLSYGKNGRTSYGVTPEAGASTSDGLGADAVGLNCGTGPEFYPEKVETYSKFTSKPILAQANAGAPKLSKGKTIYNMTPEEYRDEIRPSLPLLSAVGSCCGSDPRFTSLLTEITANLEPRSTENSNTRKKFITTSSTALPLPGNERFVEITVNRGELGKLKERLVDGKVNLLKLIGFPPENQQLERLLSEQLMRQRLDEPIGIVADNPRLVKIFLKSYSGIAPVKTSGKEDSLTHVVKKYGGVLV